MHETKRDHYVSVLNHVARILNLPVPREQDDRLQSLFGTRFHPEDASKHLERYLRNNSIGKEKLIKTRDLFRLLGVDGFQGLADLNPYLAHSYAPATCHFLAVQNMYLALEDMPIASLTGTDSACVVFLSLAKLFSSRIVNDNVFILVSRLINKVESFMHRHAHSYRDIRSVDDAVLDRLIGVYRDANPDWSEDAVRRTDLLLKLHHLLVPS